MRITVGQLKKLIKEEIRMPPEILEAAAGASWVIKDSKDQEMRLDLNGMTPESSYKLIDRMENPNFAKALKAGLKIPIFRHVSAGTNGAKLGQIHGLSVDGPHPCRQKNWKKKSWVNCPEGADEEELLSGWDWKYFAQVLPERMRDEAGGSDFVISEVEPDNHYGYGNMGIKVVNPEDYAEAFQFVDDQRNPNRRRR